VVKLLLIITTDVTAGGQTAAYYNDRCLWLYRRWSSRRRTCARCRSSMRWQVWGGWTTWPSALKETQSRSCLSGELTSSFGWHTSHLNTSMYLRSAAAVAHFSLKHINVSEVSSSSRRTMSTKSQIAHLHMHHLVFGINFQIHSISLTILVSFYVFIHFSTHLCHHLHSRHPSLLHSFTPGSKPTFSTNPSHSRFLSFTCWTASL